MLFFNIFRGYVAIGFLALPYGFKLVGPLLAIIILAVVGLLIAYTTNLLLEVLDGMNFNKPNIENLGKYYWGKFGYSFIVFCYALA